MASRKRPPNDSSVDEIDRCPGGNDAAVVPHLKQLADGFAAVFTVVQGAVVDVHADELVGERGVEVASKLHGVGERLVAVVEGVLDAVAQCVGGDAHGLFA